VEAQKVARSRCCAKRCDKECREEQRWKCRCYKERSSNARELRTLRGIAFAKRASTVGRHEPHCEHHARERCEHHRPRDEEKF
jgi:hypothetical protein